jgi:phosphomannomutase/phosphoglucomutase
MKQTPVKKVFGANSLKVASVSRGLFLVALIGVLCVLVTMMMFWGALYQPAVEHKNQQMASSFAGFYAQQIDDTVKKSQSFVSKEVSLLQNSQINAKTLKEQLTESFANQIPGFLNLWVWKTTQESEQAITEDLIGYAAIEMIQKAWNGKPVQPEVHRLKNNTTVLSSVYTFKNKKENLLIFISQDVSAFASLIKQDSSFQSGISIQQTLNGQNHSFVRIGNVGSGFGVVSESKSLTNMPWQVTYSFRPGNLNGDFAKYGFIVMLIAVLILFAAVAIIAKFYKKIFNSDITLLREIMHKLSANKSYPSPWFKLAELNRFEWGYESMAESSTFETIRNENILAMETEELIAEDNLKEGDIVTQDNFKLDDIDVELPTKNISEEQQKESSKEPAEELINVSTLDPNSVSQEIFRACDIRGKMGHTLSAEVAYMIGLSFASVAKECKQETVIVGRDGRHSSSELSKALIQGLRAAGQNVIDVGLVPTPLVYFATHHFKTGTGIMITGSHNPKDYNGFKMMIGGETLANEKVASIYARIQEQKFSLGQGEYQEQNIIDTYIEAVKKKITIKKPLKVVIDCGNGAVGVLAEKLFSELGCDVIPLYCDVDGDFPNHHPDPGQPKNLQDLIQCVTAMHADVGIAFDGDGDRLGVITPDGEIIWPDRLMMLFAIDCLSRNKGANIIFDVKCTKYLASIIEEHKGIPIMYKTGHALIKQKMLETKALLAGEMSGHFFFKESWYGFDDGCFAALQLLEILSKDDSNLTDICAKLPNSVNTPEINVAIAEDKKFKLIENLQSNHEFVDANIITVDGLRVEFADGWGLVRASNTTPCLVLRFEADNEPALNRIKDNFKKSLQKLAPDLDTNF